MVWKCDACGKCCRKFIVEVDNDDIKVLEKCGYNPNDFIEVRNSLLYLKRNGARCFFLKDNLCGIHQRHGLSYKPKVCRSFPLNSEKRNVLGCGDICAPVKFEKPAINRNATFFYKNKIIPAETLLYAIGKTKDADDWYTILCNIKDNDKRWIKKSDADFALKSKKQLSRLQKLRLKIMLAGFTSMFYPGLFSVLTRKFSTTVRSPVKKVKICFSDIKDVKIDEKDRIKFLRFLASGNGIVNKPQFPAHLLFSLYFVDDFARQIARNNKKHKADFVDMINAYSFLNGVFKFT